MYSAIDAIATPTEVDVAWTAGFLEGEGSFCKNKYVNTCHVQASQVNIEPLEKLLKFFGGSIKYYNRGNGIFVWRACGKRARNCMKLVYPLLSDKRKGQVDNAIA